MLNKIQSLLESSSISLDLKSVLEKAKEQTLFLSFIDSPMENPIFQRYIREYETFFKDSSLQQEYPVSQYIDLREVTDISKEDENYSCRVVLEFTWPRCYESEYFSINFNSSWLLAKEDESPWVSSWVKEKIRFCSRALNIDSQKLANVLGISEKSLNELDINSSSIKMNRLHNLNLACNILKSKKINNIYEYLVNSRITIDKNDIEDGTSSLLSIIIKDKLILKSELDLMIEEISLNLKKDEEYEAFLKLQKKYGELK